ncbi:MAG: sugar nucleotide-binding protein [Bacteroidetes bacterium]|nr:sugar nucleotide-binding protein [Bacteroidota bacterium]
MTLKILITGASGTIGTKLLTFLQKNGNEVIVWDRTTTSIDDYWQMESFIVNHNVDAFIHLAAITSFDEEKRKLSWQVNYDWPSELAWICKKHHIKFIFISSNMVFSVGNNGPYFPDSVADETQGYGFEKRKAEEKVIAQNPDSVILRLGWQIADQGDNSMLTFLDSEMNTKGEIRASHLWLPSCSFVDDTTDILNQSIHFPKGIYQINSNTNLTFFEIVSKLKSFYNKDWNIVQTEDIIGDQRMIDTRIQINPLDEKFN